MRFRSAIYLALSLIPATFGHAQAPLQPPVQWTAAAHLEHPGDRTFASIRLRADVAQGWHVYALTEPENGPIPLRITLDAPESATISGPITGSIPVRRQDASFLLKTDVFLSSFALDVPVRLSQNRAATAPVAVSVRYQACSEHTCLPPRTVHLSVALE